jgi:hypothetical protein
VFRSRDLTCLKIEILQNRPYQGVLQDKALGYNPCSTGTSGTQYTVGLLSHHLIPLFYEGGSSCEFE